MTRARSTNIRSLIDRTWLRTTRAVVAQLVRPITITITSSVARIPNERAPASPMMSRMIGARISARTIVGSTRKKSEIRIRIVSTAPPTNPATIPTSAPMTIVITVAMQADQHRDPGAVDGQVEHVPARARRCRRCAPRSAAGAARRSSSSRVSSGPTNSDGKSASSVNTGGWRRRRRRPSGRGAGARSRGPARGPPSRRAAAPCPLARLMRPIWTAHARTRGSR